MDTLTVMRSRQGPLSGSISGASKNLTAGGSSSHSAHKSNHFSKSQSSQRSRNSARSCDSVADPNALLKAFNPLPSEEMQKKMDYFFMPYAPQNNTDKHMRFEDQPSVKSIPQHHSGTQVKLGGYDYTCRLRKDVNMGAGFIEFQR